MRRQRLASYGLVVKDAAILLCRLAQRTSAPGQWTLPGGGLEFGEHPEEALVREIREETGFTVRPGKLIEIWSSVSFLGENEWHVLHFLYETTIESGEMASELEGSTDLCGWFAVDEVGSMPIVPLVERALKQLPQPPDDR